ncbi:MAG TPA: nicotinate (nicotinamide) nucleotide adenylyltransferase [Bacteroidia bacterium]|nr:nicotinate (nicotinamide) nucleotide adenylyltransferase [Bacteroidia bacterium]
MKIGLFFGTFNPVHAGHMVIAGYMTEFTDLEQVWFVVTPHNPMKQHQDMLADYHRLALTRIATENNRKFKVSNIEFSLPKPSYTFDTLSHISEKHPEHEFALIIGADNLEIFEQWKNHLSILEKYFLYVYPRHRCSGGNLVSHPHVKMTEAPLMEISSTFIRDAIKNKKDIRYMLSDAVHKYIDEMHFYEK